MNRPTTRESHAHRLNRVAEHIWAHLDEPLCSGLPWSWPAPADLLTELCLPLKS